MRERKASARVHTTQPNPFCCGTNHALRIQDQDELGAIPVRPRLPKDLKPIRDYPKKNLGVQEKMPFRRRCSAPKCRREPIVTAYRLLIADHSLSVVRMLDDHTFWAHSRFDFFSPVAGYLKQIQERARAQETVL